jgi:putative hydrolase of the HAD superfamily
VTSASLARPEAVFLDLGDTLMRAHPSWSGVYRAVLVEHGIDIADDQFAAALNDVTSAGDAISDGHGFKVEASPEASYQRMKRFDMKVLAALRHHDLPDAFFRAVEAAFMQRSSWHVFPDVVPAVGALRAAGIRLGVISNWTWSAPELLHDVDLARHFEALVISARVGYQKPHPAIFRRALDELDVTPEHAIHVGDSYVADVSGARGVGILPVLIDRHLADPARLREEHGDPTLAIVSDLYQLLDLLGVARPAAPAAAG